MAASSREPAVRIGCAGWSLPKPAQPGFGEGASHLQRYATRLSLVEINSSFHRPHRREVYQRWAAQVPDGFVFSVKLPRAVTHDKRLADCASELDAWRGEIKTVAVAAAGGLAAGAATVAAVNAVRAAAERRKPTRVVRRGGKNERGLASRSFLIDVHVLDR